jgi:molybdate transport system substrate-binding protein
MPDLRRPVAVAVLAFSFFAGGCGQRGPAAGQGEGLELIIAAAADLTPAFEELGRLFEQETGVKVTFSFGSTGNLAKQIENGAPIDLFAAANISFIEDLERKGLIIPETKQLYARGRITLWTRADSPLRVERIEDLARGDIGRVAIANPSHAPYGIAAREAIEAAGVRAAVEPKLVFGENVRQALQYAETGNADAAIVALSLSVSSKGRWVMIPEKLHRPLDQALAVIRGSGRADEARRFADFINGRKGRPVMQKYGFVLPGEEPGS